MKIECLYETELAPDDHSDARQDAQAIVEQWIQEDFSGLHYEKEYAQLEIDKSGCYYAVVGVRLPALDATTNDGIETKINHANWRVMA